MLGRGGGFGGEVTRFRWGYGAQAGEEKSEDADQAIGVPGSPPEGGRYMVYDLVSREEWERISMMTNEERKAALEAIIYAADEPATTEQLAAALGEEKLAV